MGFRYLGRSGLQISALTFGNWLTQHSPSDVEAASRCVRAALDAGITSFDSADSYANGVAEECLGAALAGERRESLTVMTKVFFPVGPQPWGKNDCGLSREHIMAGIDGSLRRLRMDYVDVYYAHRFDRFTPLEETMQAFADIVHAGKALYIGVSEWTPEALREGQAIGRQLGFSLIANQVQYSMLWRVIESEVIPVSEELGISQLAWSPLAQGVLSGKYRPGRGDYRRVTPRADRRQRPCGRRRPAAGGNQGHRRDPRRRHHLRPGTDGGVHTRGSPRMTRGTWAAVLIIAHE